LSPPFEPDAVPDNAGADYLRTLKGLERQAAAPVAPTGSNRSTSSTESFKDNRERRRAIRYKCEGSAEFRVEGSDVRTWGNLKDVSLHGCYVEMSATFPVGSIVNMVLDVGGIRVKVKGEVRVTYPFLGMGIAFMEMSQEEHRQLQNLANSLSQSSSGSFLCGSEGATAHTAPSPEVSPVISNPAAVLNALFQFFQTKNLLSRQDFLELLRKSQSGF
jgi:hypothetical protein